MSVLRFPRLYFRGAVSWDPGLANNFMELFDPVRVELRLPADVPADDLKQSIIEQIGPKPKFTIWNYFGTHDAVFEDVTITGGATAAGHPPVVKDAIVGSQVSLRGKLVDLDAAALNCSQLFFDRFAVGGGGLGIHALPQALMHARWINLARNLARLSIAGSFAATWQVVFAKADLRIQDGEASPLLGAFAAALADDEATGLMTRFHTYRTEYFQNGLRNAILHQPRTLAELGELYLAGHNFSNPAYSQVVGSIGIWHAEDTTSVPGGRFLVPAETVAAARRLNPQGQEIDEPVRLGPAVAELNATSRVLSIDLGASIPERDATLEKADLGELIVSVEQGGTDTVVAVLPPAAYARASYEASAGIIDLDLMSHPDQELLDKLARGRLALACQAGTNITPALREAVLVSVAEERDVYLNEGEQRDIPIVVFEAGDRSPPGTHVLVSAYDRRLALVEDIGVFTVGPGGTTALPLRATQPGFVSYQFLPFAANAPRPVAPAKLDSTSGQYLNVRTLPLDDALARETPDEQLTWSFVYHQILRVYDVLNPVMGRAIGPRAPLNDRSRMEMLALSIKRVIARTAFERTHYMPITRDMSVGRRRLLDRWCDLVLDGVAPSVIPLTTSLVDASLRDPRTAAE